MNKKAEIKVILSTVNILDMNNIVEEFKMEYGKSWSYLRICIDNAFAWEDSQQGYYYWLELHKQEQLYVINNVASRKVDQGIGIYLFLSKI